jgi:broad specificity phosphatase PhoE
VELTPKGVQQARAAGERIKQLVGDEGVTFIVSPFKRTLQTFENVLEGGGFSPEQSFVRQEPRLREQEFGMFQDPTQMKACRAEKNKIGSFFYRWPRGESGCDVYDRVSGAIDTLQRHFKRLHTYPLDNVVIVSHGLTNRLFLMRWFHWTGMCER